MPKKNEVQEQEVEEKDLADIAEQLTPFVKTLAPQIIEYQKIREPVIRRGQWINFIIMMTTLLSITILAVYKIVDGSAATGLIGAIIGYVFGGLYQQRNK